MTLLRALIIFCTFIFVIRTVSGAFFRTTPLKIQIFDVFGSVVLCFCSFIITKRKIFVFGAIMCALNATYIFIKSKKREGKTTPQEFIDHILMSMRVGFSIESALRQLSEQNLVWKSWILESDNIQTSPSTKFEDAELINLLRYCRKSPSQSFTILDVYRKTLRLKTQLQEKHHAISLQAKAQAVVSGSIFIVVFGAQWFMQPDFKSFFSVLVLHCLELDLYLRFQIQRR
jgi:hypothetical protein